MLPNYITMHAAKNIGRGYLEDLALDGRIILKSFLKNFRMDNDWAGVTWLVLGRRYGLF